jgi:LuxR family maltose regulon positive regulatory protein
MPSDDDPVSLLRSLVESLSRLAPVDDAIVLPLSARPLRLDTVARRLGKWLLERPEPFVLVVDNADFLHQPETHEILELLAEHLPPQSRIALSGRFALPLTRRRIQALACELGSADLAFTDREVAKLFSVAGLELDAHESAELNRRAEGWPAGVVLAALALGERPGEPACSAASLNGAHHFVGDYFESEVLSFLDHETLEFVTHASLLDWMSGPACDDVLGVTGSGERLERLLHDGGFVVPLDGEHRRFRFHRLFRDAMSTRLEQREPQRFVELSRRAAVRAEHDGDLVAALDYLRGVGDHDEAARVLGASGPQVYGSGLLGPLEPGLVDLADDELLEAHQSAAVVGALVHALLGHPAAAARWVAAADEGPSGQELDALHAALCRDGVERMLEDAQTACDGVSTRAPLYAFARLLEGIGHALRGEQAIAEVALSDAAEQALAADAWFVLATAYAELSLLASDRGEWSRAEELARSARDASERLDDDNAVCGLVHVASARSALRNSNWVRVGEDLDRVHRMLPRLTEALPWLSGQVRVELARTHLALNDLPAVRELLAELDGLMLLRPHLATIRDSALNLRDEVERLSAQASGATTSLTAAELRLLPLLTTHLTFRQIADHLYVSRNTIKTQAISVYRKLGVTSRAEAIDRANELGFLRSGQTVERLG